ncbi:putative uncharacterized protein DDB_G0277255 isoform X2 [Aphidius gifuensis]|uniref:putative uncharacterized protein DDB_G0277255 isoform X2 n=1 Tax=Aphidius gifuensis TaxID=684658 RepID=UPI001CDCFB9C|nr:putative uncharacterized protein DDB_G0277255 isoform X2 [Aphidius gifuensis]
MKLVSKSSVFNQSFVSIQIIVVLLFGIFNNVKLTNATSLHRDVNQEEFKNNELINRIDGNDDVDEDGNKLCISCKIMNDLIGTMKTLMNKLEDVNRKHCSDGKNRGARAMTQWMASDERDIPGGFPGNHKRPPWLNRRNNVNGQDESPSGTNQQQEPSVDREPSPSALPPRPRYRIDQQKNQNTNTNFNSLGQSADVDDNDFSDKQQKNPANTQGISRLLKDKKNNNENDDNNISPTYIIDDNYDQEHGKSKNKVVFVCSRMKDTKRKRQMGELKNSKKNSYRKNNDMSSNENNNINTNINVNSNSFRKNRKTIITPTTEMIALNSNDTVAHNETDLNNTTSANNEGTSRPM